MLQNSTFHHGNPVSKGIGLRLVMGNKNGGAPVLTQIMLDAATQDGAELRFKLPHGFIEKIEAGLADEGAAKAGTLLLPS